MKFYVVNINTISIDSEWGSLIEASQRAIELRQEGGVPKVMTKPRVGGQELDPKDPASWKPKRNNPRFGNPRRNPSDLLVVNGKVPEERNIEEAADAYREWHQKEPNRVGVFDTGCDGTDVMVCVGKANNIIYRSGKWEKGRKTNDYIHDFDSRPKVWMLKHLVAAGMDFSEEKTVDELLNERSRDVAELAAPLSFSLNDGSKDGTEVAVHSGAKVYGATDRKTVLIIDPHWKLIVVRGGKMYFDERGIVH